MVNGNIKATFGVFNNKIVAITLLASLAAFSGSAKIQSKELLL